MGHYIRELSEITESREFLESKPHPFIPIFITILILAILTLLVWSYFGEMDIVTKANGEVRPNEKVSTIQVPEAGQIAEINYTQGQTVKKGEVLIVLKKEDLEVELASALKELEREQEDLENLRLFKESIQQKKNLFSSESSTQAAYYEAFEQYQIDMEKFELEVENSFLQLEREMVNIEKTQRANIDEAKTLSKSAEDEQLNKKYLIDETKAMQKDIHNLNLLKKSYENEENLLSEKAPAEFAYLFKNYQTQIDSLKAAAKQKEDHYSQLVSLGETYVSKTQLEQAKHDAEEAQRQYSAFKSQQIKELEERLISGNKKLKETELQIAKIEKASIVSVKKDALQGSQGILHKELSIINEELTAGNQLKEKSLEKLESDKINEINNAIKDKENSILLNENKVKAIKVQMDNRTIEAPIDGIINVQTPVNINDLTDPGKVLATIIPNKQSEHKVLLSIPNSSISKIKLGDEIKYHLPALPYKEYGELKGRIINISSDSVLNEADGLNYYTVEASIQNKPLYSYKGKEAKIKIGMQTEAFVITDRKKMIHAALEKLNFKN